MKKKRFISLMLVALLLFGTLCSCGQSQPQAPSSGGAEAPDTVETGSAETASGPRYGTGLYSKMISYDLPLVDKEATLSYFCTVSPMFSSYIEDYSQNESVKALEALTGVKIDYYGYMPENAQTQFNIMAAAGDMTDIVLGGVEYYVGGMDVAVNEGILLSLGDYLEYCPNFSYLMGSDASMKNDITTDSGNIIGFVGYSTPEIASIDKNALMIRGDWLDKLNMEVPSTYDELNKVLLAFKNELDVPYPMVITSYLDDMSGSFASGYDIEAFFMMSPGINVPFYVVDGQVKCAIAEDGFKDYLGYLNSLVSQGLTAPEIENKTNEMTYQDLVTTGQAGFFWGYTVSQLDTLASLCADPDAYFVACPKMRQNEDQTLHFNYTGYQARYCVSLSANCSDVELACKWLDCHYSEEISMMSMYGIEDLSYKMVDNVPAYTEIMTSDPSMPLSITRALYCLAAADSVYYTTIDTDLPQYSEAQLDALNVINSGASDGEYALPEGLSFTPEESERFSALITDLGTYMSERVLKFIVGDEEISEYGKFVSELDGMGLSECVDMYQTAYQRYLAR